MAAYGTPNASLAQRQNELTRNKELEDAQRRYSQFISQEQFRRGREDTNLAYQRGMPKVGSAFNRRGMWNSGLRRGGQRQFTGDFKRNVGRIDFDQGRNDQQYALQQAASDANYQAAMQQVYDEIMMASQNKDPYANIRDAYQNY